VGRRGNLQNLPCGPTATCPGSTVPDDQFGGPQPDNAHLTGVILRLNDDGSAPSDNPFFEAGADMGGEVGANLQKIFSYGHRNSFGIAVDPASGNVWLQENGDDTFSELNRIEPGLNGGWVQIADLWSASPSSSRSRQPLEAKIFNSFAGHPPTLQIRLRRPCPACSCFPAQTIKTPSSVGCGRSLQAVWAS
jgi:hypothetical protein